MNKRDFSIEELGAMNPKEFRKIIRRGGWTEKNLNVCLSYAIANLVILPKDYAFEFLLFCNSNPRPCPVLEVTEPGDPRPKLMAEDADLSTDLPRYRVYKDGRLVDEPTNITAYWRDDLVSFLIGCAATLERALVTANIPFRFLGAYNSSIDCVPVGRFHGHMVVTSRAFRDANEAIRAIQISSRHLLSHGPPVHIGDPAIIGIKDLNHPDIFSTGPEEPLQSGEIALYWGCGITPQAIAIESCIPFMITHCPGHMFTTDRLYEELASF